MSSFHGRLSFSPASDTAHAVQLKADGSFGQHWRTQIESGSPNGTPLLHQEVWANHRLHVQTTGTGSRLGRVGAVLTGHLFHARELAAELHLSIRETDPATILLHLYRRHGAAAAGLLHGEFAFALWDAERELLLLSRDSTGAWPLFYSSTPHSGEAAGNLSFGTDLRPLLSAAHAPPRLNEEQIARWLALVPARPGATFFQDVFSVPPGTTLGHQRGELRVESAWNPGAQPILHLRDPREYADGLRDVLQAAVRDRLGPEGAAATTLSGGLDSSSITALAAETLEAEGRRLFAFTAVPSLDVSAVAGRFTNEQSRASAVAAMHGNLDHILVPHGRHRTLDMLDRFSAAEMQPIFNPGNYDWLYQICLGAAHRGIAIVQMGLAGNLTVSHGGPLALHSLLAAGRPLQAARLASQMCRNGGFRLRGVAYSLLRPSLPIPLRHRLDALRGAPTRVQDYSLLRPEFARSFHLEGTLREPGPALDPREARIANLHRIDPGATNHAMRQLAGVDITDPTIDRRVVEFCLTVPEHIFCHGGVPRALIRNAMAGLLPEAVRTERLRGLQAADFGLRFLAELPEALAEVGRLCDVRTAFDCLDLPRMHRMLQDAPRHTGAESQLVYWPKLMRALSLGRFLRRVQDGSLLQAQPGSD